MNMAQTIPEQFDEGHINDVIVALFGKGLEEAAKDFIREEKRKLTDGG